MTMVISTDSSNLHMEKLFNIKNEALYILLTYSVSNTIVVDIHGYNGLSATGILNMYKQFRKFPADSI